MLPASTRRPSTSMRRRTSWKWIYEQQRMKSIMRGPRIMQPRNVQN
jgi:hypothetical protein